MKSLERDGETIFFFERDEMRSWRWEEGVRGSKEESDDRGREDEVRWEDRVRREGQSRYCSESNDSSVSLISLGEETVRTSSRKTHRNPKSSPSKRSPSLPSPQPYPTRPSYTPPIQVPKP